ncbi:MAG: PEFG-CTERM sorting domain-containing protein [Nitrosopumilus sp.]|nr:PEFG-CTERM sorting domain-containing protein [Nitrosopumilus sp.]
MNTHLSVFALFAIMIASIGMAPAFGQIVDPIVVTTDKTSYSEGDTIMVTGEVSESLFGYAISIEVFAPNGNKVSVDQVMPEADKSFSTQFTAGGNLMKFAGDYTIKVLYATENRTAETTFYFDGISGTVDSNLIQVEGTDFMVNFEITGGKLLSITPDVDANSLIIAIDAFDDGQLTITLPRELIDAKIGDNDDAFFVLVDGEEVDFDETATSTDRTLVIAFPAGAEEIEIIGTHVVPEFGTIAALILAVAIISIIAVSARSKLSIMPRY